ncbi:MAG: DUF2974 domain-containing protein [Lachnospiraceae bacterium]|nr:DUF2974 domain-containing protein [Lachnospiraceae bacterium]
METLFDYLDWRGDISFSYDGVNEVDCALFAWLSYFSFDGLLSGDGRKDSLKNICDKYLKERGAETDNKREVFYHTVFSLFVKAAQSARYGRISVLDHSHVLSSEDGVQFAAMTFSVLPDLDIIVFQGTDSTIVGWKENLELSYMDEVPAQGLAVQYVSRILSKRGKRSIICGHSKGGNLAVYSMLKNKVKPELIECVYNFDGPGMNDTILKSDLYDKYSDKIITIVPRTSIVGRFFGHKEQFFVTDSNETGIGQHDITSWGVKGTDFVYVDELDEMSNYAEETMREWLDGISLEERKRFLDTLFEILDKNHITTFEGLSGQRAVKALQDISSSVNDLDPESKSILKQVFGSLISNGVKNATERATDGFRSGAGKVSDGIVTGAEKAADGIKRMMIRSEEKKKKRLEMKTDKKKEK